MRNHHDIVFREEQPVRRVLNNIGVEVDPDMAIVSIYEDDPKWPSVKSLIAKYECTDVCYSYFSDAELTASKWLRMVSAWENGFPEPSGDMSYRQESYDLTHYYPQCGTGLEQKAPFRVLREPRWGKRGIVSLYWVPDAFFVPRQIWHDVFAPFGIEALPVLAHRTGNAMENMVQLRIEARLQGPLCMDDYPFSTCTQCGRRKYMFIRCGTFPAPSTEPDAAIIQSNEYFGDGALGYRETLISVELYRAMVTHKVRKPRFTPAVPERRRCGDDVRKW